jgi:bifunctional aspartokinase / homoserine dehydrogenase 1
VPGGVDSGRTVPRALDAIGGMGEQMSVRLLAAYLRHVGQPAEAIDATELIVTDDVFLSATPLMEQRRRVEGRIRPLLAQNIIPIVTGFIGATADGVTTTLGRGGSDFSGAILGRRWPPRKSGFGPTSMALCRPIPGWWPRPAPSPN